MQFSQNDMANYEASVKTQKVMLSKHSAFVPNLSPLLNNLDNKFNFPKIQLRYFLVYMAKYTNAKNEENPQSRS